MATATPTEAELRAAFQHHRRASWPATFEAAMQDPLLSRLIRLQAKHPPKAQRVGATDYRAMRSAGVPAAKAVGASPWPARRPALDCKRLAAGDRDDD